jgi:hypothetical protein
MPDRSFWLAAGLVCATASPSLWAGSLARHGDDIPNSQRAAAATATAKTNPLCSMDILKSFYWEIGNKDGPLVSGRVGGRISSTTVMNIGSSSKWIYAGYVAQKNGGNVDGIVPYMNLTSGFSNFSSQQCPDYGTIADCDPGPQNPDEAANSVFHYGGGHMQEHAILSGLGNLRNSTFADEVRSYIGTDVVMSYKKPQPAGGVRIDSVNYAIFLRKLLVDSPNPLQLGALLGTHASCTLPGPDCSASGQDLQLPEAWHYSIGHWVEDDPNGTPPMNFAYSSPGLGGYYPWVDVDRKLYGILSRNSGNAQQNQPYASAQCGRLIRLAWKTGVQQ